VTGARTVLAQTRAVIVDLDGTLVHTLIDFVAAINLMLDDLGVDHSAFRATAANIEPLVGKGSESLIKQVLGLASIAQPAIKNIASFEEALATYLRHYRAINGVYATVYPGVVLGLKQLKARGLRLACLTNKPVAFAHALLKAKQLDTFFEVTFGGDSFERKKPDPLPLLKTCEALGSLPGQTLMIGDSSNDALAARAAGCPVVLVTYGYNHGQPVQAVDSDGFVDSLADLPGLLS